MYGDPPDGPVCFIMHRATVQMRLRPCRRLPMRKIPKLQEHRKRKKLMNCRKVRYVTTVRLTNIKKTS